MQVRGYTLALYCDNLEQDYCFGGHHEWNEFPHEYLHSERGSACRAEARKDGWILKRDGTAICPKCARMKEGEK